ncbi:alpha/beta hydrolase [Halalkaliarchaeum sp. AArc-GB]|uniref:alpha/beta fold hydrolase n=1 Tax=Halalkaliarchaeum sp. AArc-GB TaxID=3074078 RepID=UPI0028607E83|nr:alpha/beta hydrolase [Halalkaliarchaeum sp. AArc-GB]MDR5673272.1 alpha/beta hydrolase [Halalkaliarchaeum sp. AArc-GB]
MAEHGTYLVGDRVFPYYRFGSGDVPLVVLPGISDALRPAGTSTVTGALLQYGMFRAYREYDVWIVSRPRDLPGEATTQSMADDYAALLDRIGEAHVLGLSMGGLIAQHLAAEHPEQVRRLVLGVAGARVGPEGRETLDRWAAWGGKHRFRDVYLDAVEVSYTGYRKLLYPPIVRVASRLLREPAAPDDFVVSCAACRDHDGREALSKIEASTLVVGGSHDHFFPESTLRETAAGIDGAKLALLGGTGHAAYEERRGDWDATVTAFLTDEL